MKMRRKAAMRQKISLNKKAYVKTLEAVIALVLSFMFITYFVPIRSETEQRYPDLDVIHVLEQNPVFRTCVLKENYSCINSTFESYYPHVILDYDYRVNVSTDPRISGAELPRADVHSESLLIAGNDTYIYPKTVRIYYWLK